MKSREHQKKAGTPTMGGLLILASCLVATILLADIRNPYVWVAIFVTLGFGAIGFDDDLLKVRRGRGQGLSGPQKLLSRSSCARWSRRWSCSSGSASTPI